MSTIQKTGWTKNSSLLATWMYYGDGLVWYVLVRSGKGFLPMDVITKAQSTAISCVWDHFWEGDKGTPEHPHNRVILEQACSWPLRRPSFALYYFRLKDWFKGRGLLWILTRNFVDDYVFTLSLDSKRWTRSKNDKKGFLPFVKGSLLTVLTPWRLLTMFSKKMDCFTYQT